MSRNWVAVISTGESPAEAAEGIVRQLNILNVLQSEIIWLDSGITPEGITDRRREFYVTLATYRVNR